MYLMDYHSHTEISPDSQALIGDMAQAAVEAGLKELCITDHYDVLNMDGSFQRPMNWKPSLAKFLEARDAFQGKLTLRLGLEFGSGHLDGSALVGAPEELDFVIGSIHNLSPSAKGGDLYFVNYRKEEVCHRVLTDYFNSILELVGTTAYDSLGHLIYPLRYIERDGQEITLEPYQEVIDEILKKIVDTGHAIEINTYCGRTIDEWRPIIARYKALGGEYITTGSDAHVSYNVARGIMQAQRLLEEAGFRYITTYQGRKPIQIQL